MKKVLLTALAALSIGTAAMAQKIDDRGNFRHHAEGVPVNPFQTKSHNKGGTALSTWFGVMDLVEKSTVSAGIKGYVDFMIHDSLNKFVEDDGTIRYGATGSIGQVFDPKDDLIQLTDNPENQLSVFNSYRLDSVAFRYLYVRNVDSISDGMGGKTNVVDTLFVAYWKGAQLRRSKFTDNTTYSTPTTPWNYATRMPAAYTDIDTFLLASAENGIFDSTMANNNNGGWENSWSNRVATIAAPAGITINANANGTNLDLLTAFSFTFKPGIPTIVGTDTAVFVYQKDPATKPAGMRRNNYFGYGIFINEGAIGYDYTKAYNTPLLAHKPYAYATVNGWQGYVAGQAFNNERYVETYFHITVDTSNGKPGVGINEAEAVKVLNVYPNPATSRVNITFELATSSDVKVSIVNLVGQEVSSLSFPNSAKGKFELPMNVSNLTPGVYMVNVSAGNSTQTQKVVITE